MQDSGMPVHMQHVEGKSDCGYGVSPKEKLVKASKLLYTIGHSSGNIAEQTNCAPIIASEEVV